MEYYPGQVITEAAQDMRLTLRGDLRYNSVQK